MRKRLRLHRETVRQLEEPTGPLFGAQGGSRGSGASLCTLVVGCSAISNCYPCPTINGPDCPYTQGCWLK